MVAKAKKETLTIAVTLDGVFGFIGKDVSQNPSVLLLQDALSIGYNTDGTPRLGLNQVPLGMVDPKYSTVTALPMSNISYMVAINSGDDHKLVAMYKDFFDTLVDAG